MIFRANGREYGGETAVEIVDPETLALSYLYLRDEFGLHERRSAT